MKQPRYEHRPEEIKRKAGGRLQREDSGCEA
jgi:hypothetical protein